MADSICIFEDIHYRNLLPLAYFRPAYNLRCGMLSLRKRIKLNYPDTHVVYHSRKFLADVVKQNYPGMIINDLESDSCLFVNGRVIANEGFNEIISLEGKDMLYTYQDNIVAARLSGSNLEEIKKRMDDALTEDAFTMLGLIQEEVNVKMVEYPWDLVHSNGEQLVNDFNHVAADRKTDKSKVKIYGGVTLINEENIFIDEGAVIKPGAVLDAEDGPIFIGKNVLVYPNATIEGPVFIGDNSKIKMGATIYKKVSIGKTCKVGGEVEDSIIHGFSNKQHEGFLGHSYLGSWVNIGAGSNNSDLKNNYGSIKVVINGEQIESGLQFVGLTMGDHSKCAIGTQFNTGTVVGVSSNIYGAGFPPKYIPSFSWGGAEALTTYDLEKSIEVAERVMARRSITLTEIDKDLFKTVFNLTKKERRTRGMPH